MTAPPPPLAGQEGIFDPFERRIIIIISKRATIENVNAVDQVQIDNPHEYLPPS